MSEHTEDLFAPPAANHQEQEAITLGLYAERAYLDYAISVVKGRALPDVSDGQKPVQRRILYAMYRMGLSAGAKPVKSARVVGDVLGKYHPHGDTAAYDAMVRMAQNFSLRYPLIDGQGNFGSRDGDGAAAMRYTEARLTAIAQLLLEEIDQGTVDYIPNYDGSELEPQKLPARLPMALLNGASGIAVGMATEIPAHNLTEVARAAMVLLQQPELSDAALLQLLPGPDFAGGGQIITPAADIAQMYTTGKGSLKVRARWTFEEMARGQWQLVVTELPPAASGQKILEEIEELTNPKVKVGKKTLTTEQQQTKALLLSALDTVRDESGKDAQVRLVFEPKTAKIDRQEFVRLLLAHTSMESNVAVNLVMIGNDGRPQQKSLRQILSEWVDYRRATVVRRIQHRLEKVFDRLHVLEGRLIVFLNIDEVIRIIRESDEPKPALISAYRLSERQADDILEIRLRQLARLERIKIEQEMSDLRAEADTLQHTLDHPDALQGCLLQEMQSDSQRFGDARRTLIQEDERTVLEVKVVDEPMTVIVSEKGWLRARQGHAIDTQALHFKTGDSLFGTFECRTTDHLIACANNGRVYSIPTSSIPFGRGDGQPITTMIDLEPGTHIVQYIAGAPDTTVIFANNQGRGFYSTLKDLVTRQKAGKQFITLSPEEQLLPLTVLPPDAYYIACITLDSKALLLEKSELKYLASGGKGNILCGLHPKDSLQQVLVVGAQGLEAVGVQRGKEQLWSMTLEQLLPYVNKAARKGKPMTVPFKQPVWRTRL